jgi:hypothetical protein
MFAAVGITNKSLRACVARLLPISYSASQMIYDLRHVRMKGLIRRIEHTLTYTLTSEGQRVAVFYIKLNDRLLRPLLAGDQSQATLVLTHALAVINHHVDDYVARARLKPAA